MIDVPKNFKNMIEGSKKGMPEAICSICSANRIVIEAALEECLITGKPILVEATANQVNQFGGYTGMRPAEFINFVKELAKKVGYDADEIIFGGDHLGPLVWSGEPENSAMIKAETLIAEYAAAGFHKIHLDTSMKLSSDSFDTTLSPLVVAERAARLAAIAERYTKIKPVYVIGSEVPIPGGATEAEDTLNVTRAEDLLNEYECFRDAFSDYGLSDAFSRVIGIVVQPGVEFGDNQVFRYEHEKARELCACAKKIPGIVLEGHSTDYQTAGDLSNMKKDGIAILKVGPALTFALRRALFALEGMEVAYYRVAPKGGYSDFANVLDQAMLKSPDNWQRHYHGDKAALALMRKYSLSDRCRYYFDDPDVRRSIDRLFVNINAVSIPLGMIDQFFPQGTPDIISCKLEAKAQSIVKEQVKYVLRTYEE